MNLDQVPAELVQILDEDAGKIHNRQGRVVQSLARILTKYDELKGSTMDYADLQNRFTYHSPNPIQIDTYQHIRNMCFAVANQLNELCPDSREKSLAITKLEEVVMWANASIARGNPQQ